MNEKLIVNQILQIYEQRVSKHSVIYETNIILSGRYQTYFVLYLSWFLVQFIYTFIELS